MSGDNYFTKDEQATFKRWPALSNDARWIEGHEERVTSPRLGNISYSIRKTAEPLPRALLVPPACSRHAYIYISSRSGDQLKLSQHDSTTRISHLTSHFKDSNNALLHDHDGPNQPLRSRDCHSGSWGGGSSGHWVSLLHRQIWLQRLLQDLHGCKWLRSWRYQSHWLTGIIAMWTPVRRLLQVHDRQTRQCRFSLL